MSDETDLHESIERALVRRGLERTRENFIRMLYDEPPEDWDWEAEEQLPVDLRLDPAPDTPFPTLN
jgi:hypothetical protein